MRRPSVRPLVLPAPRPQALRPQCRDRCRVATATAAAWAAACAAAGLPTFVTGQANPALPWQPGPQKFMVRVDGPIRGTTLSLYPPGGAVPAETGESLTSKLHDSAEGGSRWYFVQLYDHMCPHCWYAVPIVTDVATAFQGEDMLTFATLNCHVHENQEACFFLEVVSGAQDFPTFLLCPPSGLEAEVSLEELSPRAQHLAQQMDTTTLPRLTAFARCHLRFIENTPSGREDPFLSATDIAQWVTGQTGLKPPSPAELERGADFTDAGVPNATAPPGRPGWLRDDEPGRPGVPAFVPAERWFDAGRALSHLLYREYRSERHNEIVDCLQFLARTLPFKGQEVAILADEIAQKGPQEDGHAIRELVDVWAGKAGMPLPSDAASDEETVRYLTCSDSNCAMWTLLHVVIAAVAARGVTGRPLFKDEAFTGKFADGGMEQIAVPSIHSSIGFVRRFVKTFLNCRTCKVDFLEDYDLCEYGRCKVQDHRQLTLWLWRMHNAISMDVAHRYHAQVDRRWPMYEDCPSCWRRDLVLHGKRSFAAAAQASGGASTARRLRDAFSQEELDAPFHLDHVFWHLTRTYLGLSRIQLTETDLTSDELSHVEAVQEEDRRREEFAFARQNGAKGFGRTPPPLPSGTKPDATPAPVPPQFLQPAPAAPSPLPAVSPPPPPLPEPRPAQPVAPAWFPPAPLPRTTLPFTPAAQDAELARQQAAEAAKLGQDLEARGTSAVSKAAAAFVLVLLILVCWMFGLAYLEGHEDGEGFFDGSARAPVLRQLGGGLSTAQEDDDDDDFVPDADRKAETHAADDIGDPAAE